MSSQPQNTPAPQTPAPVAKPTEKDITGAVMTKIEAFTESGELQLPKDYSVGNALKAAWIIIQEVKDRNGKLALEVCSQASIANALLKMVVWGLSPLKKQCDFIVYGNTLSCDPEYTGNIALAKRYGSLKWIKANTIFEGDEFEWEVNPETGRRKVLRHAQSLEKFGTSSFKGVYAIFELEDGTRDVEIMSKEQVLNAWGQGAAKGNSPAHTKFSDQMAQKSVINRACKLLIRSSDDSILFDKEDSDIDQVGEGVKAEIKQSANRKEIKFDEYSEIPSAQQQLPQGSEPVTIQVTQQEGIPVNNNSRRPEPAQATIDGPGF
ncbi:recombinase RecT [Dyadobacter bucti]|uniref:recombinase RecT n=1 Tax=Dyadobacter bucti TaxID=2572203 RepID=UPI0011093030|nr:RecT family recombinase [Dyadobacter bucti]